MRNKQIPTGLRDLLPEEMKVKRSIENITAKLFESYGYEEVVTPTFEFLEVIESGAGKDIREQLFLFTDREGGILSLRPEMTVSIARLAATHLTEVELPQRLFYMANVFRHVQPQIAQYREFWQVGIEMLGAPGPWADSEVITIAVKALQNMGLENFKISLNQIGIFNSIIEESGMTVEDKQLIRNLVEGKDLVELSRVLENMPIEDGLKETIASLPVLHGDLSILSKIQYVEKNRQVNNAVNELLKVYDALKVCNVIDRIVIDMGVLRNLDYYTGIVFEGYSSDLGYGLLGGGRYDNLLGQFGFPCPATGFALGIDRLALVLKAREEEKKVRYVIGGSNYISIMRKADELRGQGFKVEIDVEAHSKDILEKKLANRNNCVLIYLD